MATLTQRTEAVEERTERLETILASFMARTDESIARIDESIARIDESIGRLERVIERREQEGAREREEAARQRAAEREEAARQRAAEREEAADERAAERQRAAREREEAARERREMNKRWGELANKMGTIVEDIVAPSVRRLASEVFDCGEQQYFATRVSLKRSDDRSREREFDALYVGADAVLLNQTKSTPRSEDVREFARFVDSGEFARYFPQYGHLPIRAAFSSLSIPPDMVTYLTRRGIHAIGMGDEAMQVLNLEAVSARGR